MIKHRSSSVTGKNEGLLLPLRPILLHLSKRALQQCKKLSGISHVCASALRVVKRLCDHTEPRVSAALAVILSKEFDVEFGVECVLEVADAGEVLVGAEMRALVAPQAHHREFTRHKPVR